MSCISYILENNNKNPGYYEVPADMIIAVGSVLMLCMHVMFILRLFWPISYCYFLFLIVLFPLFLFLLFLNICHACIIFIIPVFILSFCNGVFLSLPF